MIFLSEELLIGEGGERYCYSFPGDPKYCIKVTKPNLSGRLEQSMVEYDYYQLLKKRKIPLDYLPECYGWIDTNLGKGLVYERVFSTSARLDSLTLKAALKRKIVSVDVAIYMVKQLLDYLVRYNVIISDLSMSNLVINFNAKDKLYLVDGVGGRNLDWKYKLRKRLPLISRYKIKQQYPKIIANIGREFDVDF